MAIRIIRTEKDPILRKQAKKVNEISHSVRALAQDMIDTMHHAEGVGLAAPQVGILKQICVIDIGEGPIVMINPELVETNGEQEGIEGCLSCPGMSGTVIRPNFARAKAMNLEGEEFFVEGEGLMARAICHEIDHLHGRLFIDLAKNIVKDEA